MKKRKQNKKRFDLKEQYLKSWNYLKESKNFVLGVVAVFFVFAIIGFFLPVPESILNQLMSLIEELLEKTSGLSQLELTSFIFFNNLQSSFYGLILGAILGLFPAITAIFNGYLLGFVASASVQAEGFLSLLRLLPHGIFELPAVFISLGLGIKLGTFVFQKRKLKIFKNYLLNSLRIFFLVVVPLLLVAAIIEGALIVLIE